jgi:hypothetical protein
MFVGGPVSGYEVLHPSSPLSYVLQLWGCKFCTCISAQLLVDPRTLKLTHFGSHTPRHYRMQVQMPPTLIQGRTCRLLCHRPSESALPLSYLCSCPPRPNTLLLRPSIHLHKHSSPTAKCGYGPDTYRCTCPTSEEKNI